MALSKIETGSIIAIVTSVVGGAFAFGQVFKTVSVLEDRLASYEQQSLPAIKKSLDTAKIELTDLIEKEKKETLTDLSKYNGVPVGTIFPYLGKESDIPKGYLLLNGQTISKSDFEELFNIISVLIPSSLDAGEKFVQLPDLKGKFLRGWGKDVDGRVSRVGDFQKASVGSHLHSYSRITAFYGNNYSGGQMGWAGVPKKGETLRHSGEGGDGSNKYRTGVRSGLDKTETMNNLLETRPENFSILYIVRSGPANKSI